MDMNNVGEMIRKKDPELWDHCCRTANMCRCIGGLLKLGKADSLYLAASIHDVGKLFVDPKILYKPGPLTEEERKIIDLHSVQGYIFLQSLGYPKDVCEIVMLHHGYHKNRYGIPYKKDNCIYADILRACDIFDAVTHDRPYHLACTAKAGLDILLNQKESLPEEIIHAFACIS